MFYLTRVFKSLVLTKYTDRNSRFLKGQFATKKKKKKKIPSAFTHPLVIPNQFGVSWSTNDFWRFMWHANLTLNIWTVVYKKELPQRGRLSVNNDHFKLFLTQNWRIVSFVIWCVFDSLVMNSKCMEMIGVKISVAKSVIFPLNWASFKSSCFRGLISEVPRGLCSSPASVAPGLASQALRGILDYPSWL